MQRPEVPGWWRWPVAAAALLLVSFSLEGLPGGLLPRALQDWLVLVHAAYLLAPLGAGALALGMWDGSRRDRAFMLGGVAAAVLVSALAGLPGMALALAGAFVPLALVAARPHLLATPLALAATAAFLVLAFLARDRPVDAALGGMEVARLAAGLAAALGLAAYALLARPAPAVRGLSRRARLAVVGAGAALLLLSFLLGGQLLVFFPLWPLALAALVVPALARWRAAPGAAALVLGVLAAGALPLGTCSFASWSDAVPPGGQPPPRDAPVQLHEVGTRGPFWS
ncbi:MAG TPA: hypothetical protein VNX21_09280, partial [Candidatus Thermoplasmatota archaeon]|nr:hypothetical protein [Candidatus Thermoplasmatota archaeon]